MSTTVTKLAKAANVSPALVSRLVNRDPSLRITDQKRQHIMQTARRLGGLPRGRGVKNQPRVRTNLIHVPVNDRFSAIDISAIATQSVFWQAVPPIYEKLKQQRMRLSYTFYDRSRQLEEFAAMIDPPTGGDGLVLLSSVADEAIANMLRARNVPHVSLYTSDERLGLNTVRADETAALAETIEHLKQLGHRRMAYLGPTTGYYRYPMIVKAWLEAGVAIDESQHCVIPYDRSRMKPISAWRGIAEEAFGQWLDGVDLLKTSDRPTAFFCSHDNLAYGAVQAMRKRGLTPGREISIIGAGNMEEHLPGWDEPAVITTIDSPVQQLGERCAVMLLRQIEENDIDTFHELVPTRLVVRQTTGPCVSAD